MDFQQIRDFVNPAVAQATGLQEVDNLQMPVPVAYVPVQLVIDGDLSLTSENPVQNKVIAVAIQNLDGRITAIEGQFSEGVTEAVNNWLAAHPEATTTVQDGAITYAKLDTNLKGEVDQISDLKSALQAIVTIFDATYPTDASSFTVVTGKYINTQGAIVDNGNYKYIEKQNVPIGAEISASLSALDLNAVSGITVYDSNGNLVKSLGLITTRPTEFTWTCDVNNCIVRACQGIGYPENTFTVSYTQTDFVSIEDYNQTVAEINEDIDDLQGDVSSLQTDVGGLQNDITEINEQISGIIEEVDVAYPEDEDSFTIVTGKFINSQGTIVNNGNYKYVEIQNIPIGAEISASLSCIDLNAVSGIAVYDSNGNFVKSLGLITARPTTFEWTCDVNNCIIRACHGVGYPESTFTVSYTDSSFVQKTEFNQTITGLNQSVSSAATNANTALSKANEALEIASELNPYVSISMFEKIGVIGDSYASGSIFSDGSTSVTNYEVSWPQIMARKIGATCINFSKGGLTTRTWLTDDKGLPLLLSSPAQQLYIIALGINDTSHGANYIGSISDIHSDFTQNPDTFYGNMGRIIGNIYAKNANAKIILSTVANNTGWATINAAIQEIATHFSIPCVIQHNDFYFKSTFYTSNMIANHPTAPNLSGMANAFIRMIENDIKTNIAYYNDYNGL